MLTNVLKSVAGTVVVVVALSAASAGATWAVPSYASGGIWVSMLEAPQAVLIGKWVEDRGGRPIGRVRSIDVGREGKAEVVNIEVGAVRTRGTQIVAVDAHQIVYYPQKAKLVATIDPPPVRAPWMAPNAPERASAKMPAPMPTSFQN